MGNCTYKVLGDRGEDRDEAWKRQTRGRLENKLYTFVDLKGLEGNTEFVEIWKEGDKSGFLRKLKEDKILLPYLYEHGDGKEITAEEVKKWQNEREPEVRNYERAGEEFSPSSSVVPKMDTAKLKYPGRKIKVNVSQ